MHDRMEDADHIALITPDTYMGVELIDQFRDDHRPLASAEAEYGQDGKEPMNEILSGRTWVVMGMMIAAEHKRHLRDHNPAATTEEQPILRTSILVDGTDSRKRDDLLNTSSGASSTSTS